MRKIKLILITLCFCFFPAKYLFAEEPVNVTMAKLGQTLQEMYPLLLDDKLKLKPKEVRQLYKHLESLETNLTAAQHHLTNRSVGYAISYDVMQQFIQQVRLVLEGGDVAIAQGMLKSVPSICGSCHSQDHQSSKLFHTVKREKFTTDFDFAEFSFYTRNYNQAQDYYFKFLNSDLSQIEQNKILSALQRVLVIQAQINKNLEQAQETLTGLLQTHKFPVKVRLDVEQWILGLNEAIHESTQLKHPVTDNQLRDTLSQFLDLLHRNNFAMFASEKEKILFIVLRGWLYDYLNDAPPKTQVPVLLYWLAQCDRILNFNSDYALADLYLKECMVNHAKHPFASKCFTAYQDFVTFSYTGSGGTDIPDDILEELKTLREIVKPTVHSRG